jgi:hypothetical protein
VARRLEIIALQAGFDSALSLRQHFRAALITSPSALPFFALRAPGRTTRTAYVGAPVTWHSVENKKGECQLPRQRLFGLEP